MSGSGECRLKGLCIKASPLGENDRLITILTDEQGIVRLAVPGARRPKSSLAAATPLTYLSFQIFGKRSLKSVRQIKIIKSYNGLGKNIDLAGIDTTFEISPNVNDLPTDTDLPTVFATPIDSAGLKYTMSFF